MYYRNEVISYLQANRILALKLDHALTGIGKTVSEQIKLTGAGAKRALYYASCFTDEYQDVCQRQKNEDLRFKQGVFHLIERGGVIYDMLNIYYDEIFKYKTFTQIEYIKKILMAANVHIAASSLTNAGFALAVAASVAMGLNVSLDMSALSGRWANRGIIAMGAYGIVQKAADSAYRLHIIYPAFYDALYVKELEMMYFLIEPLFERTGALKAQWASDGDIADIIIRMIR